MVLMVDSTDHITGKTGLTLTITASKAGAAFASISPTVTERGSGWYSLALTTAHLDTLGDFALHITGATADPADLLLGVVAYNPEDATALGLSWIDAAISTRSTLTQAQIVSDSTPFLGASVAAIKAKTDNLPASPAAVGSQMTLQDDAITAAKIAAGSITSNEAPALANLDVAVSTRLATAGYTAPANTDITSIKAKTDNLPTDPADQSLIMAEIGTRLATAAYTAPDNAGIAAVKAKTDNLPASPAAVGSQMNLADGAVTAAKIAAAAIGATQAPNLDAAVSSRLAAVDYTAPDNVGISTASAAAQAVNSRLPDDPADESIVLAAIATRAAPGDTMGLTAGAVDLILDDVIEAALTLRQALRIILAGVAGKSDGAPFGPIHYRDLADTKDRIIGTVDLDGNRTVVAVDGE
jgi:hypothetical protein